MRSVNRFLLSGAIAVSALAVTILPASAADPVHVMVFNEDIDGDAIPSGRESRIHKRLLDGINNEVGDQGITVIDELTAGMKQGFARGRVARSPGEIIDIARTVKYPPVDVALIYTAYASVEEKGYISKLRARVEGRLIQVDTAETLGSFEYYPPERPTLPADCNNECLVELVGDEIRKLGNVVGAMLGEKLAAWEARDGTPGAYTLEFDGFTAEDIDAIEEYLVIFSGYDNHRIISANARNYEIWYNSQIGSAKLVRNLRRTMSELDLSGDVSFSGRTVVVRKNKIRAKDSDREGGWGW